MQFTSHGSHDRKRIAFYGLFGQGNLGNESTLQAILHHARKYYPDADFMCICTGPQDTSIRHNLPALPISSRVVRTPHSTPQLGPSNPLIRLLRIILIRIPSELLDWLRAIKTLKDIHMLIVPGTGFLTDSLTGPLGWPYEIFKWSSIARLLRCHLLYVSVGAGPIYSRLGRWFIKSALFLAHYRSYRDISTLQHLTRIGFLATNDLIYPDLAFSLEPPGLPPTQLHTRPRPVVGIGLMCPSGRLTEDRPSDAIYVAYLRSLALLVGWLLDHNYGVRLLIGDFVYDNSARQDFRQALREYASTYDTLHLLDEPILSVEQLMSQLAATDFVIATRFHNVLLALLLNKPVMAITFHHKCVSLMSQMGLAEYCHDMKHLDADRLIQQFLDLEKHAERLRTITREKTAECRAALQRQYAAIFSNTV